MKLHPLFPQVGVLSLICYVWTYIFNKVIPTITLVASM